MSVIWSFIKGVGQVIYFMVMRVLTYRRTRRLNERLRPDDT